MEARLRSRALRAALAKSGFSPDVAALAQALSQRGLRERTVRGHAHAATHLLLCVHRHRRRMGRLSLDALRQFAQAHARTCRCEGVQLQPTYLVAVVQHLFPVLACLHPDLVATPEAPKLTATAALLAQYALYLEDTCGLRPSARTAHLRCMRALFAATRAKDVAALGPRALRVFVEELAARRGPSTVRSHISALRSFFRFLSVQGHPSASLGRHVPAVPSPRLQALPRALGAAEVERLLRAVDRTTPMGKRTWAALQLALGLGLRAEDIARLTLDDVDWRAGTLRVRAPKERRETELPLPQAAGEALADYLRHGRPASTSRHLLVRHFFPVGAPASGHNLTVAMLAVTAPLGLRKGARGLHALRHTVAGRLVQSGASLKEVADVLRHRDVSTTRGYLRVDWPQLAEVALPWPAPAREAAR